MEKIRNGHKVVEAILESKSRVRYSELVLNSNYSDEPYRGEALVLDYHGNVKFDLSGLLTWGYAGFGSRLLVETICAMFLGDNMDEVSHFAHFFSEDGYFYRRGCFHQIGYDLASDPKDQEPWEIRISKYKHGIRVRTHKGFKMNRNGEQVWSFKRTNDFIVTTNGIYENLGVWNRFIDEDGRLGFIANFEGKKMWVHQNKSGSSVYWTARKLEDDEFPVRVHPVCLHDHIMLPRYGNLYRAEIIDMKRSRARVKYVPNHSLDPVEAWIKLYRDQDLNTGFVVEETI